MKHLKLFFALFAMLALNVGNAWGEKITYQHVFTEKPSTGNSIDLSGVNWNVAATNLGNYNSQNYAGVQIGTSKKDGSITLTSTTDWDYNGNGKITEVRLWLNLGGTSVTPTVTIGGKVATSDGTKVVINKNAGLDWTKATKVTFTPVADGNTGVVVINVSTVKAGYICAMEIDCEPAAAGGGGGGTLSCTWDLSTNSYSAASAEQVTWSSDDDDDVANDEVYMIVEKGAAGTAANDYLGGTNNYTSSRFYQNSILKINHKFNVTVTKVVFTATTEDDATALLNSDWGNVANATASGNTVTVTPNDPVVDITAPIRETCEFIGVTVYYTKEPVIVKTLKSIAVEGMTTTFDQGDVFKFDGTCTATYSVTKDDVPQEDETAEVTPTSVSTPDMSTTGNKTITVSYTENEVTKTTTYDITVSAALPKFIIDGNPLTTTATTEATTKTYTGTDGSSTVNIVFSDGAKKQAVGTGAVNNFSSNPAILIGKTGKNIHNSTPFPGKITKFELYYNKGAAKGTSISVTFSTTLLTEAATSGDNLYTVTFTDDTYKDKVYDCTSKVPEGARYFWYQVTNNNNSQVQFRVTYEVDPTAPSVTIAPKVISLATPDAANGIIDATYKNIDLENVSVGRYNDKACTEAFSADWLTASLDGEKNVTYTIAENTTYTERKAYIKLTAPETTGATEPAVVVIPVTQEGKEKVFASLEALLAAITPTTEGVEVTVTLTNEVIKDFYKSGSSTNGIALNVPYQGGVKEIEIYCNNVPAEWVKGGKVSGTITCPWKLYNSTWELCPTAWTELTYTAPATVKSIAVSGIPTKTTYIDGEAFDPTGLVVTATLTDDSTEPIDFPLVEWTFDPATLSTGQTSVNVTAKYNSVTSAAYVVNGLTVNDIPTKTVAEFIEAEGGRCYLEGIVSNISNTTYGNFDLTDASGTIYVYGCLNASGESKKFAELGVKDGDKIKVIADEYEFYQNTTPEAKNVQYVSHISAATITIADITMEVEEDKTISATVEPAEAEVTYTIKKNAENAISLSGNTITALAVGTAIITATVENGATYMGNSVDFTVTVGPKTEKTDVVILAELDGKWYAMKGAVPPETSGQLAALEVTYFNGILYNVPEDVQSSITWTRSVVDGKATFVNKDNSKYLKGTSANTNLVLDDSKCEWTFNGTTYTIGNRTFLYRENYNFRNYATDKADASDTQGNYSSLPVVTAPVYATGDPIYTRTVTNGNYGTICIPYASTSYSGAEFYEVSWLQKSCETPANLYLDQLAAGTQLEAGKPYIFRATSTEIQVTCTGAAVATPVEGVNGLTGTFKAIPAGDLTDMLVIAQNKFWTATAEATAPANRAYINPSLVPTSEPDKLPGRRRVALGAAGENEATGMDNITTTDTPVKVIENGQLIIIRDGVKYNVQGVRL